MNSQDKIDTLNEVLAEISRINAAAGRTVFNPAAREAIVAMVEDLENQPARFKMRMNADGGKYLTRI